MEITCKRDELINVLHMVQPVVGTKAALPVLGNLLLETKGKRLDVTGTDLEVGVRCCMNVSVIEPGAITLPAKTFSEVVRELPADDVTVKVHEGSQVRIKSGKAIFNLMGLSKEDYPVLPKFEIRGEILIDQSGLTEMIRKTIFSVSHDETRYVLCGIYFNVEKGKMKMVSTDGRRLSYISREIETEKKIEANVIVPIKAVNELSRILTQATTKEEDGKVRISIEENQIGFLVSDTILISRLIEGHFPNYEQVIPQSSEIRLNIKTEELLQATRRVALLTSEKSNSIRYSLRKDELIISANTEGLGEARDVVGIDYGGAEMEIAYNPQFLIDVLRNIGSEEVFLELSNSLNPCLIRPTTGEDYISIVMPMRI